MNQDRLNTARKERPLRVAIVHYRDDAIAGGSLRVGETIANNVNPEKIEAHLIFAYGEAGPVAERARVPCHFIRAKGPKDFRAWFRARRMLRELSPDLIHYQDAVIWLRSALFGTPYKNILHVHGRHLPEYVSRKNKALTRAFMRKTDAQVCITHGARNSLLRFGLTRPEKAAVVHNSVEVNRFKSPKRKDEVRSRLNLPKDKLLLGMVGRFFWAKGCLDMLAILERLPNVWHGVFCGNGPQLPELKRYCVERRLAERVHFLYSQGDVAPVYKALDAHIFLSRYESCGLVIAEAMAAGVPVFGLEGDGEYKEAEYPLVTCDNSVFIKRHHGIDQEKPESPIVLDELAQRIEHFGNQPDCYRGMIERASDWVETRFDARIQAEAMTKIYERMAGSNHGYNTITPDDLCSNSLIDSSIETIAQVGQKST